MELGNVGVVRSHLKTVPDGTFVVTITKTGFVNR